MLYISNEDYRKMDGVSSSVLKKLLVSDAHLDYVIKNGWTKTDATILGDAIHAFFLEPQRFAYNRETDVYKKEYGEFKAGDPKLDESGKPIQKLVHADDSSLDIKGEQLKKFDCMVEAVKNCPEATTIIENRFNVEYSFFAEHDGEKIKVRCDMMYKDDEGRIWIVDLKTVGGNKEKPSSPEKFSYNMFDLGYDLQAYMYTEVIKQSYPDVYGFKFICIDAKCPSGVKIYDIVPGVSKWYELGGYRFQDALNRYKKFKNKKVFNTYDNAVGDELELSFSAADALAMYQEGGL